MAPLLDRLKQAASKAGRAMQKDPRLQRAAGQVKETVEAFKEGYRQQAGADKPQSLCPRCRKPLPEEANFCPHCGTKLG